MFFSSSSSYVKNCIRLLTEETLTLDSAAENIIKYKLALKTTQELTKTKLRHGVLFLVCEKGITLPKKKSIKMFLSHSIHHD